jgi:hypothetical protein
MFHDGITFGWDMYQSMIPYQPAATRSFPKPRIRHAALANGEVAIGGGFSDFLINKGCVDLGVKTVNDTDNPP